MKMMVNFQNRVLLSILLIKNMQSLEGNAGDENYITTFAVDSDGDGSFNQSTGLSLYKDVNQFGFVPNYMAMLVWEVRPTADKSYGYGMIGFETAGTADIPTTGTGMPCFTGEGQGQYHDKDSSTSTGGESRYFAITATADFTMRKVTLQSSHTCSSTLSASSTCAHTNSQKNQLNFKGELSYGLTTGSTPTAINDLTGTIKTAGDDKDFANADGSEMNGTADAKFYGPLTDGELAEFGGTFSLTSGSAGYVGYFGGELFYPLTFLEDKTTTIGGKPALNDAFLGGNGQHPSVDTYVVHSNRVIDYNVILQVMIGIMGY